MKKKNVKPPVGRPTKLNSEIIKIIATSLGDGLTRETAARIAGIHYMTFYEWRRRGMIEKERRDAGESPLKREEIYLNLYERIEEAETDALKLWQQTINIAARKDPVWAEKMLKLRDPKGYRDSQVDFTAEIDYDKLNKSQLKRIADGENIQYVLVTPNIGEEDATSKSGNDSPDQSKGATKTN